MKIVRKIQFVFIICLAAVVFSNCEEDAFGKSSLSLISNSQLYEIAREQYDEEIAKLRAQGKIVDHNHPDATLRAQYEMLQRIGNDIKAATETWLRHEDGNLSQINDYFWEFTLVHDDTVNAWAMPGALIVFYTGILPVCENEAAVATVMGHEVAHALLDHARQRMSRSAAWQLFAELAGGLFGSELLKLAINLGANLRLLDYSRDNEYEADEYGQILMAIAGYDPSQAAPFWVRMDDLSKGSRGLEFLSTHPDPDKRTDKMRQNAPAAEALARSLGVTSFKPQTSVPGR